MAQYYPRYLINQAIKCLQLDKLLFNIVNKSIKRGGYMDEEYDDETFEGEEEGISLDGFLNDEDREKWWDDHRERLEDFK